MHESHPGLNQHLQEISFKLLQICWLLKADGADDEISTLSHPTHVQHFRTGENDIQQDIGLIETCDFFIFDCIDIILSVLDGDSPATLDVGLHTRSAG